MSISIGARRSKNSSIGFSLGTETGITVAASAGKGHGSGQETVYSNTRIEAGEQVRIDSGGNTTLRGAVVAAPQVKARIQGDMLIESLQDTSVFQEESQQVGGSVTFGLAPGASVSASRTKIDSNLASVGEQSAIRAGDGGFDVQVKGATDLKGGAITSTQAAIDQGLNTFESDGGLSTNDIHNTASFQAKSSGVTVGVGSQAGASGAGVGSDKGSASSVTASAISGIVGNKAARTGDAETGIAPIFDKDRARDEVEAQVAITKAFGQQASKAASTYIDEQRKELHKRMQGAESAEQKAVLKKEISDLALQERALNILIGAVTGLAPSAILKEGLDTAADEMRRLMIEDSNRFAGITDGKTVLSNASGRSEGIDDDGYKLGGTRLDLDGLCGADNGRCKTEADGSLSLDTHGVVQFDEEKAGMSLEQFLRTPRGKQLAGPTGGIQGATGTLFGTPYAPGSWQDKLIEAFAGTHDYIGGSLSGLYDEQGNATRGRGPAQSAIQDRWSEVAIPLTLPFAAAQTLPNDVWRAISILLRGAR